VAWPDRTAGTREGPGHRPSGLAGGCGPNLGRPLADELADIAGLPLALFVEHAAYAIRGGNSGPPLDRLLDDAGQPQQLRRAARLRSTSRRELTEQLLDAPTEFRAHLLDFLAR